MASLNQEQGRIELASEELSELVPLLQRLCKVFPEQEGYHERLSKAELLSGKLKEDAVTRGT